MDKLIQKRRGVLGLLLLIALILPVMGCQQQEVYLEDLLPRDSVQQAAVNYLNIGVGENIPRVDYASGTSQCDQLLSLLYGAAPVVVEIPSNYSPEINASHEIFLTTSGGTMSLYYDDYQNLLNVPINRRVDEESVRVYLSFQPTGLAELLSAWGEGLSSSSASTGNTSSFVPPDDSALRASIDSTLFDQVSAEIAFTASTYERSGDSAVYYAFGSAEMPSLPQDQVLFVAAPAVGDARQAAIASISESDFYILVRVAFSETATGSIAPSAVLCVRADVDKGKPIVFVDADQNILYVQTLTALADNSAPAESADPEASADPAASADPSASATPAPSTSTAPTQPATTQPATTPASASGGEIGSDEPLQP